jgi:hypothetical protein
MLKAKQLEKAHYVLYDLETGYVALIDARRLSERARELEARLDELRTIMITMREEVQTLKLDGLIEVDELMKVQMISQQGITVAEEATRVRAELVDAQTMLAAIAAASKEQPIADAKE